MIRGRLVGSVFGRWPVLQRRPQPATRGTEDTASRGASAAGSNRALAQDLARSDRSMTVEGRWNMAAPDARGPSPDDSSTPPHPPEPTMPAESRHRLGPRATAATGATSARHAELGSSGQPSGGRAAPRMCGLPYVRVDARRGQVRPAARWPSKVSAGPPPAPGYGSGQGGPSVPPGMYSDPASGSDARRHDARFHGRRISACSSRSHSPSSRCSSGMRSGIDRLGARSDSCVAGARGALLEA